MGKSPLQYKSVFLQLDLERLLRLVK
jgi:hypothetical protein